MIELKTSKGEFVVKDMPIEFNPQEGYTFVIQTQNKKVLYSHTLICKLSEATEEDAKLIVDEHNHYFNDGTVDYSFRDYRVESEYDEPSRLPFAIDSLKTLLKSKGIDVNNGNLYLFKIYDSIRKTRCL